MKLHAKVISILRSIIMENNNNSDEEELAEPFQKKEINLKLLDKIVLVVGCFTLLPIRTIIFIPCFGLIWFTSRLGIIGMDETLPASGVRRNIQRFNYHIARFILRVCFGFISPNIIGDLPPLEDVPVVVAAPHTSFFDLWVACWIEREGFCSVIVREENKGTPFVGTILRFQQVNFVKRDSEESRQETLDTIVSRTQDKAWGTLIIFPEGTTGNGSSLLPFKRGGFLPGISRVQPVVLRYPNRLDCTTWTKGNGGLRGAIEVIVRAMATLYSRAELEVMPAVVPEGDPLIFGEMVRKAMGQRSGVPLYEDKDD